MKIPPYLFAPPEMVTQRNEISTIRNKVVCVSGMLHENKKNLFAAKTRNTKKLRGRSCANSQTSFLPFAFYNVQSKAKEKGKISPYLFGPHKETKLARFAIKYFVYLLCWVGKKRSLLGRKRRVERSASFLRPGRVENHCRRIIISHFPNSTRPIFFSAVELVWYRCTLIWIKKTQYTKNGKDQPHAHAKFPDRMRRMFSPFSHTNRGGLGIQEMSTISMKGRKGLGG